MPIPLTDIKTVAGEHNCKIHSILFKNFDAALAVAKIDIDTEKFGNSSRDDERQQWSGTKTFDEAFNLAYTGWKDGLDIIHKNFTKYRHIFEDLLPQQDVTKQMEHDTSGEVVDVGRVLEGIPENMLTFKENTEQVKVISGNKLQRIIFNATYSCAIEPAVIALNGSLLTLLVEQFELHGFRTELIYREAIEGERGEKLITDIPIKQFDESPDFNKIAFMLAHPSMLRRITFSLQENLPTTLRKTFRIYDGGGYGQCIDYNNDLLLDKNNLYVPSLKANYETEQCVQLYRNLICNHFSIVLIDDKKWMEKLK